MAKVIVQAFKEGTTKKGTTIYKCSGTIDGEMDFFEMWSQPEIGKEYEGEIKENEYGKTFSLPRSGGGGRSYGKSAEERMEIVRQNALTNAVNRAVGLSQILAQEDAVQALKPSNILAAAEMFAKFTSGELKTGSAAQPASSGSNTNPPAAAPSAAPVSEDANRQANQQAVNQDVNPDELPF